MGSCAELQLSLGLSSTFRPNAFSPYLSAHRTLCPLCRPPLEGSTALPPYNTHFVFRIVSPSRLQCLMLQTTHVPHTPFK